MGYRVDIYASNAGEPLPRFIQAESLEMARTIAQGLAGNLCRGGVAEFLLSGEGCNAEHWLQKGGAWVAV